MRKVGGRAVTRRAAMMITAVGTVTSMVLGMVVFAFPAGATTGRPGYHVRQILSGQSLHHWYTRAGSRKQHRESLTQPDDITVIRGNLFTGFQNGSARKGRPARTGTVTARSSSSRRAARWSGSGTSGASATA